MDAHTSSPPDGSILIVDDHAPIRRLVHQALARQFPRYRILEAEEGGLAVALASELRPAAVIMDLSLPGISGLEAAARIRQLVPGAVVIMFSLDDSLAARRGAAAAGAHAYITKDEGIEELGSTLARLMGAVPGT